MKNNSQFFLFPITKQDLSSEIETTDEVIDEVVESIETDETPQKPSTPTPTTTVTNQRVKLPVKTKGKQVLYLLITVGHIPLSNWVFTYFNS